MFFFYYTRFDDVFADAPRAASIATPELTVKGEVVILTCNVTDPGFPPATLEWTRQGSTVGQGSTLLFDPLGLNHAGVYTCTPSNDVGQGTADSAMLHVLGASFCLVSQAPPLQDTCFI